jgi:hypothetical protein
VAENGPEMVIDNKAWTQMDPAVKEALVQITFKAYKDSRTESTTQRKCAMKFLLVPALCINFTNDNQLLEMVLMVVSENTQL